MARLGFAKIGDAGAKAIAYLLEDNQTLTTLSLNNDDIGVAGAKDLAGVLVNNDTLEHLFMSKTLHKT